MQFALSGSIVLGEFMMPVLVLISVSVVLQVSEYCKKWELKRQIGRISE